MAMTTGDGGGFTNEINVTPMIDILLVLLIIFMFQVTLQRKAMEVNVPPVEHQQQSKQQSSNQIVMILGDDGSYKINNEVVPKADLDKRLHEIYDNRPAKLMFIKAGGTRKYQEVIEAMDIARGAGVQVIGFTPPDSG